MKPQSPTGTKLDTTTRGHWWRMSFTTSCVEEHLSPNLRFSRDAAKARAALHARMEARRNLHACSTRARRIRGSDVQLGHGSMEIVLSCVFSVERCETCCARSVGNFVGHERCGDQPGCWMHRNDMHRIECIWTWMPLRKDLEVMPRILARNRTPSSCAGIARSNSEHPNVAR